MAALGALRWKLVKVRREHEAKVGAVAEAHRSTRERCAANFAERREELVAKHAQQRDKGKASARARQPKKFEAMRASISNLRRLGRATDDKEALLRRMEQDYWERVAGVAFEEAAKSNLKALDDEEAKALDANARSYRSEMMRVRRDMDAAVHAARRARPTTSDDEVWKACHLAGAGQFDKLRDLLSRRDGAVHERDRDSSWTPLFFAARSGHAECATLLLQNGADVRARDEKGQTALHVAAAYSSRDVALVLLEHDADPAARDHGGTRPVDVAKQRASPLVGLLESWMTLHEQEEPEVQNDDDAAEEVRADNPEVRDALTKLRIKERAHGCDYPGLVPTLVAVADAYRYAMGDPPRARDALERAAALTASESGPNSLAHAAALNNLGELYHEIGDDRQAREALSRALSICDEQSDAGVVKPLQNLALHLFASGDVAAAIPLLRRLLKVFEREQAVTESPALLPVLKTLGYAHLLDGSPNNARATYHRALRIAKAHGRSDDAAQLLEYLGIVEYYSHNFGQAEAHFFAVFDTDRKCDDDNLRRIAENAATAMCRHLGPRVI